MGLGSGGEAGVGCKQGAQNEDHQKFIWSSVSDAQFHTD